jgi:hypothetical protein
MSHQRNVLMASRLARRGNPVSQPHRTEVESGTLSGLREPPHEWHACCLHGDRWHALPLACMAAQGKRLPRLAMTALTIYAQRHIWAADRRQ